MKIAFDNYVHNQIVSTPIIILKGRIITGSNNDINPSPLASSSSDESPAQVNESIDKDIEVNLCTEENCTLFRTDNVGVGQNPSSSSQITKTQFCSCSHTIVPIKIVRERFVLVVQLKAENNLLIFIHNKTEISQLKLKLVEKIDKLYIQSLIAHCSDSTYEESYIEEIETKINLGLYLAQSIFSELLVLNNLSRRCFYYKSKHSLRLGGSGQATNSKVLRIDLTKKDLLENYTTKSLWEYLARQIKNSPNIWSCKCKYVVFVLDPWKKLVASVGNATVDHESLDSVPDLYSTAENKLEGLGGGGLAILDSNFLNVWPKVWSDVLGCMLDETDHNNINIRDGGEGPSVRLFEKRLQLQGTIGKYYSKSLGGLIHEMGHIFDLGHTQNGIMGNEYHHSNLIFAPFYTKPNDSASSVACALQEDKHNTTIIILPPHGQIKENTFSLTKSSATILHYHRWFRDPEQAKNIDIKHNLTLQLSTIKSTSNLKTIELRDITTGLVIKSWLFEDSNPKTSFIIGKRSIPVSYRSGQVELVVQNEFGDILKETLECHKLPEIFTDIKRKIF